MQDSWLSKNGLDSAFSIQYVQQSTALSQVASLESRIAIPLVCMFAGKPHL